MVTGKIPAGTILLVLIAFFLMLSCQSSRKVPVIPSGDNFILTTTQNSHTPTGKTNAMWGYWHITINPESCEVETIPLRGVMFAANVNTFLEPGGNPGPNLGIALDPDDSDLPNNLLAVDVTLKHPLPYDEYSGFDVRGIFIQNGSVVSKSDPDIIYGETGNDDDAVLLNADGYTRWWNPNEFLTPGVLGYTQGAFASFGNIPTATLNGYKAFADDLGPEEDFREFIIDADNYPNKAWFAADSTNSRRYMIQFPVGQAPEYDYCVFASWEKTDPKNAGDPDEYEPGDWGFNANCPEAFLIKCDSSGSTAYYNSPSDNGGILNLKIEVFDWQGIAIGNIDGEIAEIRIESLSAMINEIDNTYVIDGATAAGISDKGSDISSVYAIDITNLNLTQSGEEKLLISVLNADPNSYDSGFGMDYPSGAPLAAYLFTTVTIGTGAPCPVCDYDSDLEDKGYDEEYECSESATVFEKPEDDNTFDEVPIGFIFNYAGIDYTTAGINPNGVLFLGNSDVNPATLECADPDYNPSDCIVANSDDLHPDGVPGGEIKYETRTVGSDLVFIVEWEDVPSFEHPGETTNTFQIILFDSSDPDCDPIRIQWLQIHTQIDTLIQYNSGNLDIEVCLYDGYEWQDPPISGGQPVPGAIEIVKQ